MSKHHPTHKCPRCNVALVRRTNQSGGGIFWGCENFEVNGCKVYYSTVAGLRNPHVEVARASRHRSAVKSLRESTIDAVILTIGCPRAEVVELLDREGLDAVRALVAC